MRRKSAGRPLRSGRQQDPVGGRVDLAEGVVGQGLGEAGQPDDVVAGFVAVGGRLGERLGELPLGGGEAQLEGAGAAGRHIQPDARPAGLAGAG
jgi:hypothetical protein